MPVTAETLRDDAEVTIVRETETDAQGAVIAVTIRETPKPGTAGANADQLRQRAQAGLAANATFLALVSPTVAQSTAQVQRLTRQCSALIRLMLQQTDDITGT